jgi:nitroreductase
MNIIESLNWRYATKVFDPSKKVSDSDFEQILEALRLSPSSFGMQPWKFVVVNDPAIRESLVPHSWGQRQVADACRLLVLCRPLSITDADVDRFIQFTADERGIDASTLEGFGGMIKGFLGRMSDQQKAQWMKDQVYIALGNLMTTTAVMGIDACPMEGFVPQEYDRILNLADKGLTSVVACPVGYRSAEDKYAEFAKIRYPMDEIVIEI